MDWLKVLQTARLSGASDVHLSTGEVPWLRVDGQLRRLKHLNPDKAQPLLTQQDLLEILAKLLPSCASTQSNTDASKPATALLLKPIDFAVELPGLGRFRVNAFLQARGPAMVMRLIPAHTPTLESLDAPACVKSWGAYSHGLVLMTGPTGSGKSTLLAALLTHINTHRAGHILSLEDPIEFKHPSLNCLVHQREVGRDTPDFESGLRAALREDPDVILLGEMRDISTIRLALTAAETGHLVLSTLHTASAPQAIDRLVDAFPSGEKEGVRALFAECLVAVLAQTLCPALKGEGRVAAHEIMVGTPAVRNLIREGKVSQLYSLLQTGQAVGMQTLDQSLCRLYQSGKISGQTLRDLSKYPQNLKLIDNLKSN
jgi:twitching motility protein PilT